MLRKRKIITRRVVLHKLNKKEHTLQHLSDLTEIELSGFSFFAPFRVENRLIFKRFNGRENERERQLVTYPSSRWTWNKSHFSSRSQRFITFTVCFIFKANVTGKRLTTCCIPVWKELNLTISRTKQQSVCIQLLSVLLSLMKQKTVALSRFWNFINSLIAGKSQSAAMSARIRVVIGAKRTAAPYLC